VARRLSSEARNAGIDKLLETGAEGDGAAGTAASPPARSTGWLEHRWSGTRRRHRRAAASRSATPHQGRRRAPTFAIFGNRLSKMPESYRALCAMNGLRESFDLGGAPIRFSLRGGKDPSTRTGLRRSASAPFIDM